jgi:LysM repeat protein
MRRKALGKHRWSVVPGLLLCITAAGPIYAAPERASTQIAIGNPLPNSLVAGRISLSVAYNHGVGSITALTVFVDDKIQFSKNVLGSDLRGVQYLDLDTRTMTDGNHAIKVVAMGTRGPLAIDEVLVTVRNGINGGADLVPPLVQFRSLQDGDTVSGKLSLDLLAEDNSGMDLLVSVFVNRFPRLIKSRPPYTLDLNTAEFLDPITKRGTLMVEAWAYDKANNLGKSRQITLNVVPAGVENATRRQEDPTKPTLTSPMLPETGIKGGEPQPMAVEMPGELVLPLRSQPSVVDPKAPTPETAKAEGRLDTAQANRTPGTRPTGSAPVRPQGSVRLPAPQANATSQGGLSGTKFKHPVVTRPAAKALTSAVTAVAPELLSGNAASALGAPRPSTPALRGPVAPKASIPQAPVAKVAPVAPAVVKPVQIAQANSVTPEIVAPSPVAVKPQVTETIKPVQIATSKIEIKNPEIADRPGELIELANRVVPMSSQGGVRVSTPTVERPEKAAAPSVKITAVKPAAKKVAVKPTVRSAEKTQMASAVTPAAKPGVVFAVIDKKRRDKNGQPKVDLYRVSDVPTDRSYHVRSGDSLHAIARKFKTTPKAIQVANALTEGARLRTGSIIRVPGTFDVVMNDKRVAFDVSPRIENGLPLTPFRQIMEYAGGVVVWYPESQEIRAANEQTEIKLKIGSKEAMVNQTVIVMDREAFLDSGRTMVPMSFLERALDLKAEYDVRSGTIMLVRR